MNTALILPPTESSFRLIAGLPLIQRTVLGAMKGGFERVVILPGKERKRLEELLDGDGRMQAVELLDQQPALAIREGQVVIMPADCLVTPAALSGLAHTRLNGRPMVFSQVSGDTTVVACRAETLAKLPDLSAYPERDAGARLACIRTLDEADAVTLEGDACLPVTDAASARRAEKALLAQLRASTADSDGPLARWIDRSASQWLSYRLVRTPLRPNHITAIGAATGLLAAWCIAQGVHFLEVFGACLFLCATVIDGCDGEVARLKFQETHFGHLFDVITDNIVHVAIFFAIGLGQHRQHPGESYTVLIGLLLGGFACAAAATYWCFLRAPQWFQKSPKPQTTKGKIRRLLLRGFEAIGNRDFAYLLLVLALFGRLHWFFWGTLLGTYGFTAALIWVYRWRDAS